MQPEETSYCQSLLQTTIRALKGLTRMAFAREALNRLQHFPETAELVASR